MSLNVLADLFLLLLVLGVTTIVLHGWGNFSWRLLGVEQPNKLSVMTVWLGFCIVVGCIEIVHLFVPIDWKVTLVFSVIGVAGQWLTSKSSVMAKDHQSKDSSTIIRTPSAFFKVIRAYPFRSSLAAIVVVVWCLRAMEVPTMYDSGLYHFGSIRWTNEHAIVPGLGNLHWRLGLNQSYFGFLALLNIAPFWGKGYAAGGVFLIFIAALTLLDITKSQSWLWICIFGGTIFAYLCLLSRTTANPMPDTAVVILEIVIFLFLQRSISLSDDMFSEKLRLHIVLVLLCLTLVTIKLSGLGFAFASLCLAYIELFKQKPRAPEFKSIIVVLVLSALLFVVHLFRGYLLSGAPLFPSPIAALWMLPWAVEAGVASNETDLIAAWAKQPGLSNASDLAPGYGWIFHWFAALPNSIFFIFLFSVVMFVFTSGPYWKAHDSLAVRGARRLAAVCAFSLCFWFFTAPDVRFLGAVVVLFFSLSVLQAVQVFRCESKQFSAFIDVNQSRCFRLAVLASLCLFFRWSLADIKASMGWADIPTAFIEQQINRSGISSGVAIKDGQCWNTTLPCAILLHDNLRREPLMLPFGNNDAAHTRFMFVIR